MKNIFLFLFYFFAITNIEAQSYKLTGRIQDIKTDKGLSFATIKIVDSSLSTTADKNGDYILKLGNGYYKLIISYIGYFSDTASVFIENKDITRDIYLKQTEIFTKEIEVIGEDPAYDIVRKAIKYKKEFKKNLHEYNYEAFSKFILRTNIAKGDKDSTEDPDKLPILGILESETKGYFKEPDLEKQIVKSKRETANITQGVAIPLIVNFYDEDVDLGEVKIPGPLSDGALDEYEYKLTGTTSLDSTTVYKIKVINTSNITPQFAGSIYIIDSTFALIKIDLNTNDAGNPRGLDKLNFIQKFSSYSDKKKNNFWMPTDIQIYAEGTLLGLIKFKGEVYTVVSDYNVNEKTPKGIFDDIIIKVLPDAGKKDSTYWAKNQLIKNSNEEIKAFKKIEKEEEKKSNAFSLGLSGLSFGKYLSFDFFDLYRFNRIEGHQLKTKVSYENFKERIYGSAYYAYGFSDKKSKYEISSNFSLLKDKSIKVNVSIFNKLNTLFRESESGSMLENSILALLAKIDEYNYFYENGFDLNIHKNLIPQIGLNLNYSESKQSSAFKRTDYSFFKRDENFSNNPLINNAFSRKIGFSLRLDPNTYKGIDWGNGQIDKFSITNYPSLTFNFNYSGKNLRSTFENRTFSLNLFGQNNFNSYLKLNYRAGGILKSGEVPYQDLIPFNTSFLGFSESMAFYTMDYNEFLGDKLYYFNIENNFGKLLWGGIPFFKSFDLIGFFNIGRSEITNSNFNLAATKNFSSTKGIFTEAGFGIGRILDILRLNFAWRLNNYNEGKNFVMTLILQ